MKQPRRQQYRIEREPPRTRTLLRTYLAVCRIREQTRRARLIVPRQKCVDKDDPYVQLAVNDIEVLFQEVEKAVDKLRNLWGASMSKDREVKDAEPRAKAN